MAHGGESSGRVLVFAPVGRDGELIVQATRGKGLDAVAVSTAEAFAEAFREGCGAVVLTEEALYEDRLGRLRTAAEEQPTWSEAPFVVLTSRGQPEERVRLTVELMQPLRNVTVLERPVRSNTMVMALEAALRDRRRQYEVRDSIADLERRVEERTADLVRKIGELEGFCYAVSHDMRTPLRAIVSNAAMVMEEEGDRVSDGGRLLLERLSTASLKMASLIDDLLKYARLGAGEARREPCDLSAMARRIADEATLERGLPASTVSVEAGLEASCDPKLLGLVLHNLIDNALKYVAPGRTPRVDFGGEAGSFYVRDNGIGFEMRFVDKVFRPFERLHRDDDYPGTGIGLANVKRIVESHGGRVWAESVPGTGTTFRFTLGGTPLPSEGEGQE